jgi:hypothetical protein
MTIQDFMELLIDGDSQHFNIYDNEKEEIIFDGAGSEMPDELIDEEISSIDNIYGDNVDIITLNIN